MAHFWQDRGEAIIHVIHPYKHRCFRFTCFSSRAELRHNSQYPHLQRQVGMSKRPNKVWLRSSDRRPLRREFHSHAPGLSLLRVPLLWGRVARRVEHRRGAAPEERERRTKTPWHTTLGGIPSEFTPCVSRLVHGLAVSGLTQRGKNRKFAEQEKEWLFITENWYVGFGSFALKTHLRKCIFSIDQ